MIEDKQLLGQYAAERSEAAFAELVRRHLKMVYGAALRQVNGDAHLAEDVAQTVFADLARKAGKLQHNGSIAGWLYISTRFTAANAVRAAARRRTREQVVVSMNEMNSNNEAGWDELRPMIDEALNKLGETDREAIVLRYLESNEFSRVGAALGVSENAARMRVERALEKLRVVLERQGIATTGAALSGALVNSSATTVPVQLAAHITSAALTHTATAAGSTTSILKLLIMKKITLIAVAVLAVSLTTVVVVKSSRRGDGTGIRTFRAAAKVTSVVPGETLIMGGWSPEAGKRVVVSITPMMVDAAGNKLTPPFDAPSQIVIDAKFASVPEKVLVKLGLQSLFTQKNDSKGVLRFADPEFRSLINAFDQADGTDLLSAPRVLTLLGRQARVAVQENQVIAGRNQALGPLLDVVPTLSADGASVDIDVMAEYTVAAHGH